MQTGAIHICPTGLQTLKTPLVFAYVKTLMSRMVIPICLLIVKWAKVVKQDLILHGG